INSGSYNVTATIDDGYYQGSASGTLVIHKATPTVTLDSSSLSATYDGLEHDAIGTVTGIDSKSLGDLTFTYNASTDGPVNAGSYTVVGSFSGDDNYEALDCDSATLVTATATPTVAVIGRPDASADPFAITYDSLTHEVTGL